MSCKISRVLWFLTPLLFESLDYEREGVSDWVANLSEEDMRGMGIDELTPQVMAKFYIAPLEIAG